MGIVDEKGRLFGVVNVIDLAVVAVVLATVIAGAAFVLMDDQSPPPEQDRYLTVILDEHPGGSPLTIDSEGATAPSGVVSVSGTDGQMTDTYVAPTGDEGFVTIARIRISISAAAANHTTDRKLVTDNRNYSVGQEVSFRTDDAAYQGYVHAVDRSDTDLPVRTTNATVVTTLPSSVADRIESGDSQVVAGSGVARITGVERAPAGDDRTRVEATVELRVFETDDGPLYGTQHVRPGADVTVAPGDYEFTGTVTEVG